ncbi:DUF916 and DUF3324 domain-containing protein [Leuconostoc miyukkimchii]|uniref:DUF916 and DUF3324 domain-containing protein n=1 Tax=Leuconostoc miyukkimchii TaxID=910540 RepID=UPI001FEAA8FD|nr:DUF916 and DUF3324 domain-containing protein [Leuconostoc miyukkimchii]
MMRPNRKKIRPKSFFQHFIVVATFFSLLIISSYASEISFSVNTVIPDNQIDKSKTYFNLKLVPDQQQDIIVTLKNDTKKNITVEIGVNPAKTNSNGVVEYGKTNIKNDNSLTYPISDVVKGPSSLVLPAGSSKNVTFHITMPKESFDGILLGGLTFQQKSSEVNQSDSKKNTTIQNEFAYAVAILLRENDKVVKPNLSLISVKPGQENYRNVINAEIKNNQAVLLSEVKVDAKVYAKNSKKPVYTSIKHDMQIAPNSLFRYPISLNGTEMKPGEYTYHMKVTGKSNNQSKTWQFTKQFKIEAKKAKALNQSDVDVNANTNNTNWVYPLIALVLLVIVIILLIIVILLQRKKKTDSGKK